MFTKTYTCLVLHLLINMSQYNICNIIHKLCQICLAKLSNRISSFSKITFIISIKLLILRLDNHLAIINKIHINNYTDFNRNVNCFMIFTSDQAEYP